MNGDMFVEGLSIMNFDSEVEKPVWVKTRKTKKTFRKVFEKPLLEKDSGQVRGTFKIPPTYFRKCGLFKNMF